MTKILGPATGTCATTCTPGPAHVQMMLEATDIYPLNIGLTGKGNTASPVGLQDTVDAGVVGLKLHEDWGTTPAAIDTCLSIAESNDIQVTIHTDTLNESCCLEDTIAAFKNRTIHTYHSEGAGGGHAPDIIQVCGELHVLPSSTNPTRPYTVNTLDEHLDMLVRVCVLLGVLTCGHFNIHRMNDRWSVITWIRTLWKTWRLQNLVFVVKPSRQKIFYMIWGPLGETHHCGHTCMSNMTLTQPDLVSFRQIPKRWVESEKSSHERGKRRIK